MQNVDDVDSLTYVRSRLTTKRRRLLHRRERLSARLNTLEARRSALSQHGLWAVGYLTGVVNEIEDQLDDIDDLLGGDH